MKPIKILIINPNTNESMTESLRGPIESMVYNNVRAVVNFFMVFFCLVLFIASFWYEKMEGKKRKRLNLPRCTPYSPLLRLSLLNSVFPFYKIETP